MIRHHIGSKPNAQRAGATTQIFERFPSADISGYLIIRQTVGARCRLLVPAYLLNPRTCRGTFPYSDKPQRIKARFCKEIKLLIGNLIKASDSPLILFTKLVQPHQRAFCNHYDIRHPVTVGSEPFIFLRQFFKMIGIMRAASTAALPCRFLLF